MQNEQAPDTQENRTAPEPELDFSDWEEETDSEQQPPLSPSFAKAAAKAAEAVGPQLAAAEAMSLAGETQDDLNDMVQAILRNVQQTNPRLANYVLKVSVRAQKKRPKGLFEEPESIVAGWIEEPKLLEVSGTKLIERLNDTYAPYPVSKNFLSNELHEGQKKLIRKRLIAAGITATLGQCRSLSAIKQIIYDHHHPTDYDEYKRTIKFARDGSHVIWEGKRMKVYMNRKTPSVSYKGRVYAVSTLRRVFGA